ncbi:MAG: hypothetical protein DME65_00110 [Verrucomicrobia bacterium]|nr:MAG: hypothetical protein DME65_00110 [Verrucomicrobiota bacterium]
MPTLMRNGRDRPSENPFVGHARKERVLLIGTDQRITGSKSRGAASPGLIVANPLCFHGPAFSLAASGVELPQRLASLERSNASPIQP